MRSSARVGAAAASAVALLVLVGQPHVARAQGQGSTAAAALEQAKDHFNRGQDLYLHGQYEEAAIEFLAAHDAKPFPAFYYNAAVCYEREAKYAKALDLYHRYLNDSGGAVKDRAAVEARIQALQQQAPVVLASSPTGGAGTATQPSAVVVTQPPPANGAPTSVVIAPGAAGAGAPAAPPSGSPSPGAPATPAPPLPAPEVKGIVIIESDPPGATVWLDDKQGPPLGTTPWEGSIDKGHHTILIEAQGFRPEKKDVEPTSDHMIDLYFALAKEHFLGWVQVTGGIAGADVYVGGKSAGALGRTPFTGFLKPGKYKLIVSKAGYNDWSQDVTVTSGEATMVTYSLTPWSYGTLNVEGTAEDRGDAVYMDGSKLCSVPCHVQVDPGDHRLTVERDDSKDLDADLNLDHGTEATLKVHMEPTTSRVDAVVSFVAAAGFAAGGAYLGKLAKNNETALEQQANQSPPPFSDDPRYSHGLYESLGADACFAVSGLTAALGIYYLFRDAGPESTGELTTRQLVLEPGAGPGVLGLAARGRF